MQEVHGAGVSGVLRCVFRPFVPAFCPLCCFAVVGIACEIWLISRFKGVFSGFLLLGVGLLGLGALRGLWGFCVACGAFVCVKG